MIGNTNSAPIIEIKGGDCMSSYLTFVENSANPNVDVVSAALGKGNEDEVKGVGKALAMYAWFKGETDEFTELQKCETLEEVTSAMAEIGESEMILSFIKSNPYALETVFGSAEFISFIKSNKTTMEWVINQVDVVDYIRNTPKLRAQFNRNRVRLLMPGDVSWTVPNDFPADFVHIQLVGGGSKGTMSGTPADGKCGQYKQFVVNVRPGDVLTGNIGAPGANYADAGSVTFADVTAEVGGGSAQTGAFLVKASNTSKDGFEGGSGGDGYSSSTINSGDMTLGSCEGTGGGGGNGNTSFKGENGGGGGGAGASNISGYQGGAGYGGGGGMAKTNAGQGGTYVGSGGSGAIVITMPDGYIPEFVCYNHEGWIRDENIFNDFGDE